MGWIITPRERSCGIGSDPHIDRTCRDIARGNHTTHYVTVKDTQKFEQSNGFRTRWSAIVRFVKQKTGCVGDIRGSRDKVAHPYSTDPETKCSESLWRNSVVASKGDCRVTQLSCVARTEDDSAGHTKLFRDT